MIYNKLGTIVICSEDKFFTIGDNIKVNKNDEDYQGAIGYITEIRTGDDKETDNEGIDIHCSLSVPEGLVKTFEKRFSDIYGTKKTIDDIILDEVILSADMIDKIN